MRVRWAFAVLMLCEFDGYSQDSTFTVPRWALVATPLTFLDPTGSKAIDLGCERSLSNRISAYAEFGFYPLVLNQRGDISWVDGWYTRVNLKHVVGAFQKWQWNSVSIGMMYKRQRMHVSDSVIFGDTLRYLKDYGLDKTVIMTTLQYHVCGPMTRNGKLYAEAALGLGFRLKDVQCSDINGEEIDHRDFPGDSMVYPQSRACGNYLMVEPAMNFRLCYRLQ